MCYWRLLSTIFGKRAPVTIPLPNPSYLGVEPCFRYAATKA